MEIQFFGHSCFTIKVSGKQLLFDPFISGNPLAKEINIDAIEADYILVSHAHGDHIGDLVYLAKKTKALVIGSFELTNWLIKQGHTHVHPMNLGGKKVFEFGSIKMTYAAHSSSFDDGSYGGVAAGYLLETDSINVYYSGDTALTQEMRVLAEMHQIDWALLPIGDNFTMGMEDAAMAASFLNCKQVIGIHYDTFGLIKIDHEKAIAAFAEKQINLKLLKIGEQFTI
ncbi:MAG: metal-dependent hydrolase [Bacteroidetes bacterium B1(2017)]|nr:MAG: metal-dependent hydrolase [Bacteroidetes bacterium B1(2017)]